MAEFTFQDNLQLSFIHLVELFESYRP